MDVFYSTARFGPGGVVVGAGTGGDYFHTYGEWIANRCAVRPVVSLKSDVTTAQVKKSANQGITEDAWSGYSVQWKANGSASNGEAGNHGN